MNRNPLSDLPNISLLPLIETVQLAAMTDSTLNYSQLEAGVTESLDYASNADREFGLTVDELAAIRFYTLEQNTFYRAMNSTLRQGNADAFLPYLKLLLSGMCKLPPCPKRVFRSIDRENEGDLTWWALTSTSISLQSVVQDPFLRAGNGTIFSIESDSGVDIGQFSRFAEEEILLFPGTTFEIKGEVRIQGMPMVQLVEVANPGFDIFPRPRDVRTSPYSFFSFFSFFPSPLD